MSENMNDAIKQITSLLGEDTIKNMIQALSSPSRNESPASTAPPSIEARNSNMPAPAPQKPPMNDLAKNIDMMRRAKTVVDRLNNYNDPRINLLNALKPFIKKEDRQSALDTYIKMIRLTSMGQIFNELNQENI